MNLRELALKTAADSAARVRDADVKAQRSRSAFALSPEKFLEYWEAEAKEAVTRLEIESDTSPAENSGGGDSQANG